MAHNVKYKLVSFSHLLIDSYSLTEKTTHCKDSLNNEFEYLVIPSINFNSKKHTFINFFSTHFLSNRKLSVFELIFHMTNYLANKQSNLYGVYIYRDI